MFVYKVSGCHNQEQHRACEASTRSFRLAILALFRNSVGPRRGQVPLPHCRQELQSLS
ncbi:MAG: hypothetical protein QW594_03500 [Candidatus Woesearchaeota archaeon]